jgi:hypothetical protein
LAGVEHLIASRDSAPEDRLSPDLDPLATSAIEISVPVAGHADLALAVPLSLLRSWDDAITAFVVEEDEPVLLRAPESQPDEPAADQAPSALESTLMAGAAVAVWSVWEVRSRRTDFQRYRMLPGSSH